MAQFRLHGKKALIIQHFNRFPDITIMEFIYKWNEQDEWINYKEI